MTCRGICFDFCGNLQFPMRKEAQSPLPAGDLVAKRQALEIYSGLISKELLK